MILYELLVARLPFRGASREELFREILERTPRPPRMIDHAIPKQLEDATLKALAKPTEGRYRTAKDLADDLHRFAGGKMKNEGAFTVSSWSKYPGGLGAGPQWLNSDL